MSTAYITVVSASPRRYVEPYLYSHTVVVAEGLTDAGRTALLLKTTSTSTIDTASHLASYQADRLSSGLHGAKAFDVLEDALAHLADLHGAHLAVPA